MDLTRGRGTGGGGGGAGGGGGGGRFWDANALLTVRPRSPPGQPSSVCACRHFHPRSRRGGGRVFGWWAPQGVVIACNTMEIPSMIGYTKIIFHDAFYISLVPLLTKLVFVSFCVHCLTFTLRSSMPFAIGSVQDGAPLARPPAAAPRRVA
eukprot:SAG11_NODE_778_length_7212_cov_4.265392_5_plen_151_part_00